MNNKKRGKILNKSISRKKKTYKKKKSKVTHKKTRVKRSHKKTRGKKGRGKMGQKRRILRGGSISEGPHTCNFCPDYGQCQSCLDEDQANDRAIQDKKDRKEAEQQKILNKLIII